MSAITRLPRLGKIAVLSAVGGSFYYLRDDIKSLLRSDGKEPHQQHVAPLKQAPAPLPSTSPPPPPPPKTVEHLPEHVPYLLVGAGTASHAAMRAIRVEDPRAKVLMVGAEKYAPYMRPALSKELWMTEKPLRDELAFSWINGREKSIFYEPDEFYLPLELMAERETGGVSLVTDTRLTRLDPDNKLAHLETGQTIKYDKCLLAPGSKPAAHPQLKDAPQEVKERVVYFRSVDDFKRLEELVQSSKSVLVVGGGELGTGLASSLNDFNDGLKPPGQVIYNVFPESGNLACMLPDYLSEHVTKQLQRDGAQVIPNADIKRVLMVTSLVNGDKRVQVDLTDGQTLIVDCIVCATEWEPNVELATSSGLEVDERTGGFLVNSELAARKDVWVAGDASSFYDVKFGRRKVNSHDHAIYSGARAGHNMAGQTSTYSHQPVLYCDIGADIMMETVGVVDSKLKTVAIFAKPNQENEEAEPKPETGESNTNTTSADSPEAPQGDASTSADEGAKTSTSKSIFSSRGQEPYEKGLVFYLKDDIIVGILLWNVLGRLTIARRILNEQQKYDDLNEVAKLFNLYLDD